MKKFSSAAALLLVLLSTGCASIVDGTTQKLTVQSEPSGAEVTINGQSRGKTPLVTEIKRQDLAQMSVSLDGYKTQKLELTTKLNTTFWGNAIIGGLPGSTTDAATGAAREYSPNAYFIRLEK
ncbi:PEGA domain-containing protein [Chitinimonas arctica]|uniref:PEGA domain-containing protein n=1 Tax=Chitinimonas arctica TaxID=2594795 RepID=A0A516SLV2_9NEIS|nr:PEGA domain-containing protein [Chitinimonas arctica]QDQ29110.1 PEGA domain-containing protein [Chitinimonas arctica]